MAPSESVAKFIGSALTVLVALTVIPGVVDGISGNASNSGPANLVADINKTCETDSFPDNNFPSGSIDLKESESINLDGREVKVEGSEDAKDYTVKCPVNDQGVTSLEDGGQYTVKKGGNSDYSIQ